MKEYVSDCAACEKHKLCKFEDGKCRPGCPTVSGREAAFEILKNMPDAERDFFLQSLRQVAAGYTYGEDKKPVPVKDRLTEIIEFSHRLCCRRIGIAFCTALEDYAAAVAEIFKAEGFEVVSAVCKVGGIEKCEAGLENEGKIIPGRREITCNPMYQAEVLNRAKTDFNVVIGLCVGHDSIFLKRSDAYCTVLTVKDRMLRKSGKAPEQIFLDDKKDDLK